MTIRVPVQFEGSEAEKRRNMKSHDWHTEDHETLCTRCGASPWLIASKWPCGVEVPTEEIEEWWVKKQ